MLDGLVKALLTGVRRERDAPEGGPGAPPAAAASPPAKWTGDSVIEWAMRESAAKSVKPHAQGPVTFIQSAG